MNPITSAIPAAGCIRPGGKVEAFTLVELLVVIAIMSVLLAMVKPAMTSLSGAGAVNKAVYDVAGVLEQARAYAMSNGTYVYVGFQESDASASESGTQASGVGRVNIAMIARKDGTRAYDNTDTTSASWRSHYADPATGANNFFVVGKVQHFTNLHLVNLGSPPAAGAMSRPKLTSDVYNLADPACAPLTPFDYPLGKSIGTGTYSFVKVIQFDPQGAARIQQGSTADTIPRQIEIGLLQTHGNMAVVPPAPVTTGNVAAIQIDGVTGSTHIYRP